MLLSQSRIFHFPVYNFPSMGLQTVDDKAVEKMAATESGKHPSSGCKNGCAGVGNVAPSKVTEKYKRNKYHEVNYCYGEGESL